MRAIILHPGRLAVKGACPPPIAGTDLLEHWPERYVLSFGDWPTVFSEAKMTTGLLDRLTHRCDITETGNESCCLSSRADAHAPTRPRAVCATPPAPTARALIVREEGGPICTPIWVLIRRCLTSVRTQSRGLIRGNVGIRAGIKICPKIRSCVGAGRSHRRTGLRVKFPGCGN
jgi:hypothetical protein